MRHRLFAVLSSGVSRSPVTLVSGPAGSGKTVLVSSWLQSRPRGGSTAWLSLEETDDDPATFWAYVAEALTTAGVDLDGVSRPPAGEPVPASFTTTVAARVLAGRGPVVLVLDNSDCLTDVEICRALDLLVRHAGDRLRLVLCARADPQLPLHQYRVRDLLTEIRGESLAFTAEETQELLTGLGVPVTADVASDLRARTEGWAVGVRLAAAPLKNGTEPERLITSMAEQDGSVAQYLFAEVLERQPAPVRRFLLRISVTAELWPELVDRLSPRSNGRRILGALAHANAFVEQSPDAPGGFRLHPLFREMLKAQLQYDHPRDVAPLHQICATWYAAAGRRQAAIGHAMQAGDWRLAANLAVDELLVSAMLVHEGDPCLRVLERMPRDLAGSEAAVLRLAASQAPRRSASREDVRIALAAAADEGNRLSVRVCAAVAALCVQARDGDAESVDLVREAETAQRLIAQLPEERSRQRRELTAAVAVSRSFALLRTDAPDQVLVAGLRAAVAASTAAHSSRLRSRMLGQLALFEAIRGELRLADELADDASAVAGYRGVPRVERYPSGTAARAWVAMERYDHAEARRWIARTQEAASDPEAAWVGPLIAVLQSRLLRLRHEFDAADDVLRAYQEGPGQPRWVRIQVVGEAVRARLAAGSLDAALRLLGDSEDDGSWTALLRGTAAVLAGRPGSAVLPDPDAESPPALAVETEVLRSCAHAQAGAGSAAVDALLRALQLAEPEALRRPFFDSPPQVRRLLRNQPHVARLAGWLNPSAGPPTGRKTRTAQEPAAPQQEVLQALSERELEVLRHLAELLSTAEIAAAMFVSVNTVRTHIRSILRKLAVSRRNQAVRRGRELGLL